jgi:hypothetical protein
VNPAPHFPGPAYNFLTITDYEIQQAGMLIARNIGQVSLVRCTYDWPNCRTSRKLILCIPPPPIAHVRLAVDSTTLTVSEVYLFKIEGRLKWEMWYKELNIFENITVV